MMEEASLVRVVPGRSAKPRSCPVSRAQKGPRLTGSSPSLHNLAALERGFMFPIVICTGNRLSRKLRNS